MFDVITRRLGLAPAQPETCFPILARNDETSVTRWLLIWRCATVLCIIALILVITLVAVSIGLVSKEDSATVGKVEEEETTVRPGELVQRDEWIAQPSTVPLRNLTIVPVPHVIISHTATEACHTRGECILRVRRIQDFHIESFGFSDIAYNFLVGGDGLAYVGRDWDTEGAHAKGWNKNSIGISFIGSFQNVTPDTEQLAAALRVIELGLKLAKISRNYTLLAHRQVSNTTSPGQKLFDILKTWDHWSPNIHGH